MTQETKVCETCNTIIRKDVWIERTINPNITTEKLWNKKRYCSNYCRLKAYESFEKICIYCGNKFFRSKSCTSAKVFDEQKYCSLDCVREHRIIKKLSEILDIDNQEELKNMLLSLHTNYHQKRKENEKPNYKDLVCSPHKLKLVYC